MIIIRFFRLLKLEIPNSAQGAIGNAFEQCWATRLVDDIQKLKGKLGEKLIKTAKLLNISRDCPLPLPFYYFFSISIFKCWHIISIIMFQTTRGIIRMLSDDLARDALASSGCTAPWKYLRNILTVSGPRRPGLWPTWLSRPIESFKSFVIEKLNDFA